MYIPFKIIVDINLQFSFFFYTPAADKYFLNRFGSVFLYRWLRLWSCTCVRDEIFLISNPTRVD